MIRIYYRVIIVCFTVFVNVCFAQQQPFQKAKLALKPFSYKDVKLSEGGLKDQFKEVESYYLAISNDDLLKGFRERSGLPVKNAKDLGGWYSRDLFHVFGQVVGGLSRLYAASENELLRIKVNTLIAEWSKTIDKDGYFFYSKKPNAPHYVYEKMIGGLVDAYVFTGNKQALESLNLITDWAIKNLSRERIYGQTQSEWYTLSENLYRAYSVTNDPKYLDFGKIWEYNEYWDVFARNGNIFDKKVRHHGYSHLNTLNGAAAAYLVSGDDKYRSVITNAYAFFQNEQCFATGGFGPMERLLPKNELIKVLQNTHHTFETQCGSWAIFKFSKYLLEITGDAKYGDWIEKMIVNGIGANVPMTKDGKVHYYSDYHPREGTKHNYHLGWSCCTGTRPQAVADYVNLVYFKDQSSLYVNLYIPSEVKWGNLKVTQRTSYPETNYAEFIINTTESTPQKRALLFRLPSWTQGAPVLKVNNVVMQTKVINNWLKIERNWKNKDIVKVTFPMELYVDRLDDKKEYPAAFMYGPVAMATNVVDKYPGDLVNLNGSDFTLIQGSPLNFKIKGYPDLTLRPYYTYALDEPYMFYIDSAVRNYVPEKNLVFQGKWDQAKGPFFTNDPDAMVSTTFDGKGVIVLLSGFKNSGKVIIEIDGKQVEVVDTYHSANNELAIVKTYNVGTKGSHVVKVLATNEKNAASNGTFANFIRFKVID